MSNTKKLRVPYARATYDEKEINAVNRVLKSHNTINGKFTTKFEQKISSLFGKKYGVMVNSGSSANLLAFELLQLPEKSEVITPILTFSTTVAPIVQKRCTPVFVDVEKGKYIVNIKQVEESITDKTKALMIPSLIGNIPDLKKLKKIAKKFDLYLIEDSCDTLGAKIGGVPTGKFSDISTTSFYGSHIITCAGVGGMICVNDAKWELKSRMLASWGRSSVIFESDDIDERYSSKILDDFPYDSKYFFEEIGYNFLPPEICAAFGIEQLKKLKIFSRIRKKNFIRLFNYFKNYRDYFILPDVSKEIETNFLAFPLTIQKNSSFSRVELVKHLEHNNIQTRPIFTGNILKHPGFKKIKYKKYVDSFDESNHVAKSSFLIGCHQGLSNNHINHIINSFESFFKKIKNS